MPLRIRLKRAGSRKRPFYRVVVMDSRSARDSRSVEDLGYYNPIETPTVFSVDRERAAHWIERGAVVSDTVSTLMRSENVAHAARRSVPDFTADPPELRRPKRAEGEGDRSRGRRPARPPRSEAPVAVQEAPAPPAAEAPAAAAAAPAAPAPEAPPAPAADGPAGV